MIFQSVNLLILVKPTPYSALKVRDELSASTKIFFKKCIQKCCLYKTKTKRQKNIIEMELVNAHAAGIDIGNSEHIVVMPEGSGKERVRKFGTMTCN